MIKEMNTLEKMGTLFNKHSCFNEQIIIKCSGILNMSSLKNSIDEVQKRHFYLNCSIDIENLTFNYSNNWSLYKILCKLINSSFLRQ